MSSGEKHEAAVAGKAEAGSSRLGESAGPGRATPMPTSSRDEARHNMQASLLASGSGRSLSALMRAVDQMTDGLSGAREANQHLVEEHEAMRQMLLERTEQNASLELQVITLTDERDQALQELEQARADVERQKEFLVEEQDRFLAALLEDHEQALEALRRERDEALMRNTGGRREARTRPGIRGAESDEAADIPEELYEARRTIEKLMNERNRSREMLRRLQAQRDEAQAALAGAAGDGSPLNVTVGAAGVRATPDRPDPPQAPPAERAAGRVTAPVGPRPQAWNTSRSERVTDPLPRSAVAVALEASRPSQLDTDSPQVESAASPTGAEPVRRDGTEPGLAPPSRPSDPPLPAPPRTPEPEPTATTDKPPIKRKPDPTEQALGGYSLGSEEVEAERIEGARLGLSRPPRR